MRVFDYSLTDDWTHWVFAALLVAALLVLCVAVRMQQRQDRLPERQLREPRHGITVIGPYTPDPRRPYDQDPR